jgi:hypothetical protein
VPIVTVCGGYFSKAKRNQQLTLLKKWLVWNELHGFRNPIKAGSWRSIPHHLAASGQHPYSPPPKEWSYLRWFQQIVAAVKGEYGRTLVITAATRWQNIDDSLNMTISSGAGEQNHEGKDAV